MTNNNKANYFKRSFANFQASYDEESYNTHRVKKEELFKNVNGEVLEIGPGTGVNFPFLKGKPLTWKGIEPNPAMHPYLLEASLRNNISATLLEGTTEEIQLPDNSIDFVISTEVLCSVKDLNQSLSEIKRVLKPAGRFLFLEHVVDHHNACRRSIQKSVPYTPWKYFSDGCHPGRDIGKAIKQTGFTDVSYQSYMQEGEGIIISINRPHIYGWAIK